MGDFKTTEAVIFTIIFLGVSGMGFWASRWRRPDHLDSLDEWGLGGRDRKSVV